MARARWAADRARRDAGAAERLRELKEVEMINLPRGEGDALGCLEWTDYRSGKARRWVVRVGDRRDRMTVDLADGRRTRSHGWTWILTALRKHLSRG